ncbi:MAG: hypothetical protein NC131_17375 [Roseburia sp.]|nr:hypothetical protein [Roseburia sp.]
MKQILYFKAVILSLLISGCGRNRQIVNTEHQDSLAQYRDTLIGRFNGIDIDTLICEPIDSLSPLEDDIFGGKHFKWRIYTANNTVKDLIIGNTTSIDFISEGDLDGNGTEEWGYVGQYPSSRWTCYHAFTATNKKWKPLFEPTPIWLSHIKTEELEGTITYEDIAQPFQMKGYVNIKFSDIRNNGEDFLLIDTLVQAVTYK